MGQTRTGCECVRGEKEAAGGQDPVPEDPNLTLVLGPLGLPRRKE